MQARLLLCVALVATVSLYWIGLTGPFMFDDVPNLAPLLRWLDGQATWQEVVFGNASGMLGRQLSMASFLVSTWLGGFVPFSFKLGNLIVHLACGLLGWLLLRRLLARDPRLAANAELLASIVVALWLLHPLHVSTVLYAVQRMAQLSTLFVLAALLVWWQGREALTAQRMGPALAWLFLGFPLCLLAGLLSKENAAVAPALCLVLELAYFTRAPRSRRVLAAFFGVFVLLPLLVVALSLVLEPQRLLGSYGFRDFTLAQRLLTQPRVLMDYIGSLLLPISPAMGLFSDDFVLSTGWLTPPTTVLSILGLLGLSTLAIALRTRAPGVFAGWFFFLVAHGVESTILPLELYFEHRNYLPSFGLLLAVVSLCTLAAKLPTNVISMRQLGLLAAGGFALIFAFATLGQALVWRYEDTIAEQALKHHPKSVRANQAIATNAINRGRYDESLAAQDRIIASGHPRGRVLGHLDRVSIKCLRGGGADVLDLRQAVAHAQPKLSIGEVQAVNLLLTASAERRCAPVSEAMIADTILRLVDAATAQPDDAGPKRQLRYAAAFVYARAGLWDQALPLAETTWKQAGDITTGALLVQIYANSQRRADAQRLLAELAQLVGPHDSNGQAQLKEARASLDSP